MPLHFTDQAIESSGDVRFAAYDEDKRVVCVVSQEALQDYCDAATLGSMGAYEAYSGDIQAIASARYEGGLIEPDGTVIVRSADWES
jgi:hypothetical protein